MKKILLILLSLVLVLSLFSCGKTDEKNDEKIEEKVAEDMSWKIEEGVLIISGHGKMPDYIDENGELLERPWNGEAENFDSVVIEEGITSVGAGAFKEFQNLFDVNLNDGIKSIGESAFEKCTSLYVEDLPDELESIGDRAFNRCYSIDRIDIPKNVKTIGEAAFGKCYTLSNIKLSDSIESFGKEAFVGSRETVNVEFDGTKSEWENLGGSSLVDDDATVNCTDGAYGE
ncbi:MAG: leucine-rich repeat domain-containing protein [Clostridia bacterium]|nr:leucine-rich repeat domain-containing protein [Clostridia bacterium]